MNETWLHTPEGGWVIIAKTLHCPFCPEGQEIKSIPLDWSATQALAWLDDVHFPAHAEEMASFRPEPVLCPRCQRYALGEPAVPAEDRLHRRCFSAFCDCSCSDVPALHPVFKEPSC